jgi:hypothetical protein
MIYPQLEKIPTNLPDESSAWIVNREESIIKFRTYGTSGKIVMYKNGLFSINFAQINIENHLVLTANYRIDIVVIYLSKK